MNGFSLYRIVMAVLAVSGMAQMPVFKRYHIADVPGLAWTADSFLTFRLHYAAAAALLFWLGHRLVRRGAASLGAARVALLGMLFATGAARVIENLPRVAFPPMAGRFLDWTHLGAAMAIGIWALTSVVRKNVKTPSPDRDIV
ncbi:hypothetical protein [Fundidesulfovibrio terrae]|uniref:hypothetical protein n=1 Tax=Fundidesulfovibrio terrae TaxID=2922866 RepID=UPI001FAEA24B|nr:hypothetical protein [Fundidesulfovibrio terrae]